MRHGVLLLHGFAGHVGEWAAIAAGSSARRFAEWLDSWPVPFSSREEAVEFFGSGPVGVGWAAGLIAVGDGLWQWFDRDGQLRLLTGHEGRTYWQQWSEVRCPTLLVLAQAGILDPADVAMMIAKPGVVAVSVPGTGHDVHLERPDVINALLDEFLAAVTRGNDHREQSESGLRGSLSEGDRR